MDHESIAAFYELARAMASAERDRFAVHPSVERFHLELGREFIRSAAENRRVADRKYRLLVWNFRLLIAALSLGMALGVLFILLSRGS